MRLRVLVCEDIRMTKLIIGLPSIKAYNLLSVLTQHIAGLQCCKICGEEEAAQAVELGDGVSLTNRRNGHKQIETARAMAEERTIYAKRNQERGREKVGTQA